MGTSGKERTSKPQIKIENGENNDLIIKHQETFIPGNAVYIPDYKLKIILNIQKDKSICKIIKNGNFKGTGFLCNIGGELKKRKTLITAYHVFGEEDGDLKLGNEIKLIFGDNNSIFKFIKIDGTRSIYASKEEDITIIELLDNDNLDNYNILEIDENIYNINDFYNKYKFKSVYLLHYPDGICSSFSDNIIIDIDNDNNLYHFCSTKGGSSGAPILNIDNLKVIGVHQGYSNFKKDIFHEETIKKIQNSINKKDEILCNYGRIIKDSIYNFNKENKIILNNYNKENKIILTLKIDKVDIDKKINFLQDYDRMAFYFEKKQNHREYKININDFKIIINDEEMYESKEYFKPKKDGIYQIKIFLNNIINNCFGLFFCCSNIINIDLSSFDTKNVTNMSYMFCGCTKLTNIDLSSFNTKNVTNMSNMFQSCSNLTNIDLSFCDTENVNNMSYMFWDCNNLTNLDLSSFNTKNVSDMSYMFWQCYNLKQIVLSSFNTKKVINMGGMFNDCSNLINIDLSSFNTKNVIDMNNMFSLCSNLKKIDLSFFETKNVTNMKFMFYCCDNLININLTSFDTKKVTDMSYMFYECSQLKDLDLSSFDTKNVTDMEYMFYGCSKILKYRFIFF